MFVLIIGVILWWASHLYRRFLPGLYSRLDKSNTPVVAVTSIVAVVLMVIGYRSASTIQLYDPPAFMGHINNLLVLIAFILMFVGSVGSWLSKRMRHPMLIGFKIWAFAHLLVNGDLASLILFGGLLGWAVVQVIFINKKSKKPWVKDMAAKPGARDVLLLVVALVLYGFAAWLHIYLGHSPFLGDYA